MSTRTNARTRTQHDGLMRLRRRRVAGLIAACLWLGAAIPASSLAASADGNDDRAAGGSGGVPEAGLEELRELYMRPNDAGTRQTKIRRYELILAKGRNLVQDHPDAANLHELRQLMLQAAQAQSIVAGTAEARQQMLDIAHELADSDAPIAVRMQADLLLTHAQVARHGARSEQTAAAIARFADKYRGTEAESDSAMRALMMAFEIGHKTLYEALEHRLIREFRDDPQVVAFLRDRFGKRIDRTLVNARLERPGDRGFWRLPMDVLGRPVTVTFWAAGLEDLELKMRSVKRAYRENPEDVFLLGVNLDPDKTLARRAAERLGLDYPQVYRGRGASDPFFLMFGDSTIPSIAYIRPDGQSAAIVKERGRDDIGWDAPADREPPALALTFLRSGEFLVTRPVGPTDPSAPPELGDPDTARAAMTALQGPRLPAATRQAIQECFNVPPRRYRLGEPITGRYDRPDRQPVAKLYQTAIERCERAIGRHPEAADLFFARNRLLVALVGLSAIRTDPSLTERAAEVGRRVLEDDRLPQAAKLQADACVLRWEMRGQMDTATIRERLRAFMARYADGPRKPHAIAMAAMLALELGDGALHKDLVHEIEHHHRLNQGMRPFLWAMEDDREVGRELNAQVSLLNGDALKLPSDWRGQAGVVIFLEYTDDPEVMRKRCEHMHKLRLRQRWHQGADQPDKLNVLYAIIGGQRQQVQALVEEQGWPWPVAHSGRGWDDPLAQAYRGPGPQHGYSMLVVDPNGTIVEDKRGLWMNRGFERTLDKLTRRRKDAQARAAGRAALADSNFEDAALAFQSIVDRAGHRRPSPRTCMLLARSRAGLGQWDQAVTWIDHAHRFAVDSDVDAALLREIESFQAKFKRELNNANPQRDSAEFVPPDAVDEVMPGSRIVPRWNVVGPFRMRQAEQSNHYLSLVTDTRSGLERAWAQPLPPELSPNLGMSYQDKFGGKATWTNARVDENGFLSLNHIYQLDLASACALSYIHSPEGGEYQVGIGSDDHHVLRVNGQVVHQHYGPRPAQLAQDRFAIDLEQGWNEILIKCGDDHGGWGFYFQIVDPNDSLRFATEPPEDARQKRAQPTAESNLRSQS